MAQDTVKIVAGQISFVQANACPARLEYMPDGRAAAK
jgi:hypothetical protein